MQAEVKSSVVIPVRTSEKPVKFLTDLIEEGIRHCVSEARLNIEKISGIGIGIPGFVDSRTGVCYWTPLHKAGDFPLRDLIQKRFKITTYVENDSNTVTFAHQWFGDGKGTDNFLVITIEDGLGMGIVVNGQVYRGARGIAAEFGHVVVDPGGAQCRCGKRGCVEAYTSDFSILKAAKIACETGQWHWDRDMKFSIEDVTNAGRSGEPSLQKIFKRAGYFLGVGLSGLVQIFNPERIIISGDGVRAKDLMFDSLNQALGEYTNTELLKSVEIVVQKWRDTDWARGAACLALQEIYKSPIDRIQSLYEERGRN